MKRRRFIKALLSVVSFPVVAKIVGEESAIEKERRIAIDALKKTKSVLMEDLLAPIEWLSREEAEKRYPCIDISLGTQWTEEENQILSARESSGNAR